MGQHTSSNHRSTPPRRKLSKRVEDAGVSAGLWALQTTPDRAAGIFRELEAVAPPKAGAEAPAPNGAYNRCSRRRGGSGHCKPLPTSLRRARRRYNPMQSGLPTHQQPKRPQHLVKPLSAPRRGKRCQNMLTSVREVWAPNRASDQFHRPATSGQYQYPSDFATARSVHGRNPPITGT